MPGSAPSRVSFSSKNSIMKEIYEWSKVGEDSQIIGAQIKDNVTEQRMLESKLIDLSKERFKFIVQGSWQRKLFIDRQQRKTRVMRDLLKGVDVTIENKGTKTINMKEKLNTYRDLVEEVYPEIREEKSRRSQIRSRGGLVPSTDEKITVPPIYKTEPPPPPATAPATVSFATNTKNVSNSDEAKQKLSLPTIEKKKPSTAGGVPMTRAQIDGAKLAAWQNGFRAGRDFRFVKLENLLCQKKSLDINSRKEYDSAGVPYVESEGRSFLENLHPRIHTAIKLDNIKLIQRLRNEEELDDDEELVIKN